MSEYEALPARPHIENLGHLSLPPAAEAIFKCMFPTHQRVTIQAELGGGFSASRVFWVYPIADTPELPAVVKIGPDDLIEKEYNAYQDYIHDRLSGAAEIRSQPVVLTAAGGEKWAGLRYHLVGGGLFEIESLNAFCRHASLKDIWHVLEKRLFRRMGALWRFSDACPQFNFGASYDHLLPVNLLIEPGCPPPGTMCHLLSAPLNLDLTTRSASAWQTLRPARDALLAESVQVGDYVRLEGFVVTELDQVNRAVTLNLPSLADLLGDRPAKSLAASYRLRLQPVVDETQYRLGQFIEPLTGRVTATRGEWLRSLASQAFGLTGGQPDLTWPGSDAGRQVVLPDPLAALPDILAESRRVRVACVHGDLNLENVLVDPDARDVRLIDFATARWDHVLHDLLRVESGVVTWLLPQALAEAGLPAYTVCDLYEHLHSLAYNLTAVTLPRRLPLLLRKPFVMLAATRRMAREHLFDPGEWAEYYQGLTLYLLGALKFKNLDQMPAAPLPKQVAVWAAAMAQYLRQSPPRQETTPTSAPLSVWIDNLSGQTLDRYEIGEWIGTGDGSESEQARTLPARLPIEAASPFVAGPPILYPRQFFGRERELKRLFNLWKRTPLQNAAIIGPRRSGKTSLLLYLKAIMLATPEQVRPGQRCDWLSEPQRYRWILVDFQDARMGNREELLRYLLNGLEMAVPEVCDLDTFMETVSRTLRTPTVVLLDEIGVALRRYPALDHTFWESLRSLATHQVEGNLAFVLASHESPAVLAQYSDIGSPFFNIFGYTTTLGPLTEPEARALIDSSPAPFSSSDVDWILAQSGHWPILLQILCRERLLALECGETGQDWREEGLRQMSPFRHLLSLNESPAERPLLSGM